MQLRALFALQRKNAFSQGEIARIERDDARNMTAAPATHKRHVSVARRKRRRGERPFVQLKGSSDVNEVGDIRSLGRRGGAVTDDPAPLHDDILIGEGPSKIEVLLDDDDADLQFGADTAQRRLDVLNHGRLNTLGGFIKEKELGTPRERPADR